MHQPRLESTIHDAIINDYYYYRLSNVPIHSCSIFQLFFLFIYNNVYLDNELLTSHTDGRKKAQQILHTSTNNSVRKEFANKNTKNKRTPPPFYTAQNFLIKKVIISPHLSHQLSGKEALLVEPYGVRENPEAFSQKQIFNSPLSRPLPALWPSANPAIIFFLIQCFCHFMIPCTLTWLAHSFLTACGITGIWYNAESDKNFPSNLRWRAVKSSSGKALKVPWKILAPLSLFASKLVVGWWTGYYYFGWFPSSSVEKK